MRDHEILTEEDLKAAWTKSDAWHERTLKATNTLLDKAKLAGILPDNTLPIHHADGTLAIISALWDRLEAVEAKLSGLQL